MLVIYGLVQAEIGRGQGLDVAQVMGNQDGGSGEAAENLRQ